MKSNNFSTALKATSFNINILDKGIYDVLDQGFYDSQKEGTLYWFIKNRYEDSPQYFNKPIPNQGDVFGLIEADREYYLSKYGCNNPKWEYDLAHGGYVFQIENNNFALINECSARYDLDIKIIQAYNNAQQARFEKGNNGT